MVLQRGPQRAVLTGTATKEGDTVTAQIVGHGSPVTGQVHSGKWKVKLPAVTEPGPFVIRVSSSEGQVTLNDVLFGDVWLCSGQSNMEFAMSQVMNSSEEIQKATQFNVDSLLQSSVPEIKHTSGHSAGRPAMESPHHPYVTRHPGTLL
ncbi:sialate O-acetylesterase-like [Pomacea canaliculata]|uniref:sialate O-acetylesterase-like n=1 Tax=Pomacea canaliculata TaxID=400727 RepID=UPI000D736F54|nr:sialate O-acetylesterase-like [Pomacea canaliculata]